MLMNVVAPYLQSKGSDEGAFFDPETLEAMSKTSAWKKGFRLLMRLYQEGSDPVRNRCDGRDDANRYTHAGWMFQNGTCAFYSFWSSNVMTKAHGYQTYALTRMSHTVFPGSTEVNERGTLTECTEAVCPYAKTRDAEGRLVNSAPFAAYGGFIATVANHSRNARAMYDFFSFCNRPEHSAENVVADDGMEPWRTSQLLPQLWESKLPSWLVGSFLSTTREILNNENVVIDLRIPGAADFITEAGRVVDKAMRGNITVDEAPQALADAWAAVVDKKGGRDVLLPLYRKSLNKPPLQQSLQILTSSSTSLETWQIVLIAVGAVVLLAVAGGAVYKARRSQDMYVKQFNNNVIAERCATAIAVMDFEKVEYLQKLKNPNAIQKAFLLIVQRIREYKAYMPQSLFAESDIDDGESATVEGTQSRGSSSSRSQSSSHSRTSSAKVADGGKVTLQLRMAATMKKVSLLCSSFTTTKQDADAVAAECTAVLDAASQATAVTGVSVLYICGNELVVGANTTSQCATHGTRVASVGLRLRELVNDMNHPGLVALGACSGRGVVANCGTKSVKAFVAIGAPLAAARQFAAAAEGYPDRAAFLVNGVLCEASRGYIACEAIGFVDIDGKPCVVFHASGTQAKGCAEEWMYELEKSEADPVLPLLQELSSDRQKLLMIKQHWKDKKDSAFYAHALSELKSR